MGEIFFGHKKSLDPHLYDLVLVHLGDGLITVDSIYQDRTITKKMKKLFKFLSSIVKVF